MLLLERAPRFLRPHEIVLIDQSLRSLGPYGELRLVVEEGHLHLITSTRSFDALKWQAGHEGL
jgi:hypothetical protein